MPWCPNCHSEYDAGRTTCVDCDVPLVDAPPTDPGEPVVVLHAATGDEARVAEATLEAEGVPAYVQPPDIVLPQVDNVVMDETPEVDVLVPADYAGRAAAVLHEPPISEEELASAAESDPRDESDGQVDNESE